MQATPFAAGGAAPCGGAMVCDGGSVAACDGGAVSVPPSSQARRALFSHQSASSGTEADEVAPPAPSATQIGEEVARCLAPLLRSLEVQGEAIARLDGQQQAMQAQQQQLLVELSSLKEGVIGTLERSA